MKKGTPFGRAMRKLRVEKGETLADVAEAVGVTPAFLSAVETGKKNAPKELVSKLVAHYKLEKSDAESFSALAEQSRRSISIPTSELRDDVRDFVTVFARRFETLTPGDREKIKKLLTKGD